MRALLVMLSIVLAAPALAQPAPPDPAAAAWAQLLGEANGRVVALSELLQRQRSEIADLKTRLEQLRPGDKGANQ